MVLLTDGHDDPFLTISKIQIDNSVLFTGKQDILLTLQKRFQLLNPDLYVLKELLALLCNLAFKITLISKFPE